MQLKSAGRAAIAVCVLALCALGVPGANAGPRDPAQRVQPRQPPPASTPQTEPTDLDGGKTPQQMFAATCAVCHQSMQGLAKGRGAGQLGSFLRQHYTAGVGQANALASYLASVPERGPARATPAEPATASRRQPKPEEARRPEPAARPDKPEPAVAATQPTRRMRNEDGSSQPVEGLVVLPPGATDVPNGDAAPREAKPHETRPAAPRHEVRPGEPPVAARTRPTATPAKPAEAPAAKPAEQEKPAEVARPVDKPADIPGATGSEPVTAQTKAPAPSAAVTPLTEEKQVPVKVQEIPL